MTYESINWEAEAVRVARAFGIEGDLPFVTTSEKFQDLHTFFLTSRETSPATNAHLEVTFRPDGIRFFEIIQHSPYSYCEIELMPDGTLGFVETNWGEFNLQLARGLFHLGLLSPEIEAGLEVTITAHEKLEWKLQHEAPYDL